jgi:hypothetical protein
MIAAQTAATRPLCAGGLAAAGGDAGVVAACLTVGFVLFPGLVCAIEFSESQVWSEMQPAAVRFQENRILRIKRPYGRLSSTRSIS